MIRVVLAEDSFIVREGLGEILATRTGIEVVGAHGDLESLLAAVEAEPPEVVVTDIRMPPTNTDEGVRAAAALRESHPGIGVVVLSQFSDPSYVLALLESGSDGRAYLLKERVHDGLQLASAIEAVAAGGSVIDPKIVEVLVAARARAASSELEELTEREREVLSEIAQGKSNVAIASCARPQQARRGEAHPLDLHEARPHGRGRGQQAGQGRPALPRRRPGDDRAPRAEAGCRSGPEDLGLLGLELLLGQHALRLELAQLLELLHAVGPGGGGGGAAEARRSPAGGRPGPTTSGPGGG